jgi:superfamily II DNA or RNA helicase
VIIQLSNNTCSLINPTQQELDWVYGFLSFPDPKAAIRERLGLDVWDTHTRLFSLRTRKFGTGLLPLVLAQAEKVGIPAEVVDVRAGKPPVLTADMVAELTEEPWTLRDYQIEQVRRVAEPVKPHQVPGRGIIWSSTGSGKSRVAPAIAHAYGGNYVFLVHRAHLANDVASRWHALEGTKAGKILAGKVRPSDRFTVATIQTLKSRLKTDRGLQQWAETVDGILADECHVFAAADAVSVVQKFKNARVRIGLSGTPLDRSDKRSLVAIALMGPVIHKVRASTLIADGTIAKPVVKLVTCKQKSYGETWQDVYDDLVVNSVERNTLIVNEMLTHERPGMVFVRRIPHGHNLVRMAERAGLSVRFVEGSRDARQRDRAIKDLSEAKLDYIVASDVFNEGVDIPALRTVVLAAGGKSTVKVLQQIGRALRKSDGKTVASIIDIDDRGNKWLRQHSLERVRVMRREGYDVVE